MKIRIDKGYIKNALLGRTQFKRVYTSLSAGKYKWQSHSCANFQANERAKLSKTSEILNYFQHLKIAKNV